MIGQDRWREEGLQDFDCIYIILYLRKRCMCTIWACLTFIVLCFGFNLSTETGEKLKSNSSTNLVNRADSDCDQEFTINSNHLLYSWCVISCQTSQLSVTINGC